MHCRHHFLKEAYVFLPEPGNTRAMLAVSALARAMKEMDKVAILRCVWRKGLASVTIGVLTPNLSDKEHIVSVTCIFLVLINFATLHICLSFASLIMVCSLIHFTSMYFLLLRMCESFNSLPSQISLLQGSQIDNS